MSTELDKKAIEDSLKRLARLLDRLHMFVPKCSGDTACHYCGSPYVHEVHWREGECSWSAKYRVISEYVAAFASQVREQSIAECAKAICLYCASPERYSPAEADKDGFWSHRFAGRDTEAAMCIAGPIKSKFAAPPQTTEQEER